MEAANLGAYLGRATPAELSAAIDRLAARRTSATTSRTPRPRWPSARVPPADAGRQPRGGLAIPTWLYGHEPANLFAGGIAKYFSNAIREDTLLRRPGAGSCSRPGWAGTVQEVFQAATKAFYRADGDSGPLVFLGRAFWTDTVPVPALLGPLLAASPHGDIAGLIRMTDDVSEAVAVLTGG